MTRLRAMGDDVHSRRHKAGRGTRWRAALRSYLAELTNIPLENERFFSVFNMQVIRPRIGLIVIGAGKAGTTSLWQWLDQHPALHATKPLKEPEYFVPEGLARIGRDAAPAQAETMRTKMLAGYRPGQMVVEVSPGYTCELFVDGTPIPTAAHAHNPDARIIYLLRNPYARILSNLQQDIHKERLPAHLGHPPEDALARYVAISRYAAHLAHWRAVFPADHVRVLLLEELSADPRPALESIAEWLDLPPFPAGTLPRAANVTAERNVPANQLSLTADQFARLEPVIRADVERLSGMIGRDLTAVWDLRADRWVAETAQAVA